MQYKGTFDFAEYPTPPNPNVGGMSSGAGTSETTGRVVRLSAAEIVSPTAKILADTSATYVLNVPPYTRHFSDGVTVPLPTLSASAGALLASNNLSDLANIATARTNLGAAPLASPVFTEVPQVPEPTIGASPTTKTYVDGLAANVGKRQTVRVATTANVTIATALNNGDTIDGVVVATNDIVLVYLQTASAENGIYIVGAVPVRSSEFDTYNEHPGSLIIVQEGTVNSERMFLCTSNAGGTIDVTALTFSPTSVVGALLSANNLSDVATPATAVNNLGGATSVGTGGLARASVAVTSAAYAAFTDVTSALDALNTADTIAIRDVSASDIKEATLAILAGFWNLPVTPQMFGAKGDYVVESNTGTNDAVALQTWIDYCASNSRWGYLGSNRFRSDSTLFIGDTVGPSLKSGFSITGDGATSTHLGPSITFIGALTNAIQFRYTVWRGFSMRGFAIHCKSALSDLWDYTPTNEAAFPVTNGICFSDQTHSMFIIENMTIRRAKRAVVQLDTGTSIINGEFVTLRNIQIYQCIRMLYMAPNSGQAFGWKFYDCWMNTTHNLFNTTGFALVEVGGGNTGFDVDVVNCNSTITYDATSTSGFTSVEQLTRSCIVKAQAYSGVVRIQGGRHEGYTTILWNNTGYYQSQTIFDGCDMAGMYGGTLNPTLLADTDKNGLVILRNLAGFKPIQSSDTKFDDAYIYFKLAGSKQNTVFQDTQILAWNDAVASVRRMIVSAGTHYLSRLEFRNILYTEASDPDNGWYINQVITGSVGKQGEVPSLAFV